MARAKSRGADKVRQRVEGLDSVEVILQPSRESVSIRPREKRAISRLLWLGWLLYRARQRKSSATDREKELKDEILRTMCFVTPGVAGAIGHSGGRKRMHVEVVPSVGREVKNSLALLKLLRGCKVNVIKSLGLNTADLLEDPKKLQQLLDAMAEIFGPEALERLVVVDLNWTEYDKAMKAGKLPKNTVKFVGPSQREGSVRIDAKPVS